MNGHVSTLHTTWIWSVRHRLNTTRTWGNYRVTLRAVHSGAIGPLSLLAHRKIQLTSCRCCPDSVPLIRLSEARTIRRGCDSGRNFLPVSAGAGC